MRTTCALVAIGSSMALGAPALAVENPFNEGFDADASAWLSAAFGPLDFVASGALDGSSYVSTLFNFVGSADQEDRVVMRGHDDFDASGDAFVGDWLGAGVATLSFDIRHDAGVPITIFSRVATSGNFPAAVALTETSVPSGQWTTIMFDVEPSSWILEFPMGGFGGVFGVVGNVQIGARTPTELAGVDQGVQFDLDNVAIVPAPGTGLAGLALLGGAMRRRTRS